jgi:hypothetical protein
MQEMCKETGRSLLMSGELLRQMDIRPDYATIPLGEVKLRGRVQPIELYSVERSG